MIIQTSLMTKILLITEQCYKNISLGDLFTLIFIRRVTSPSIMQSLSRNSHLTWKSICCHFQDKSTM